MLCPVRRLSGGTFIRGQGRRSRLARHQDSKDPVQTVHLQNFAPPPCPATQHPERNPAAARIPSNMLPQKETGLAPSRLRQLSQAILLLPDNPAPCHRRRNKNNPASIG